MNPSHRECAISVELNSSIHQTAIMLFTPMIRCQPNSATAPPPQTTPQLWDQPNPVERINTTAVTNRAEAKIVRYCRVRSNATS